MTIRVSSVICIVCQDRHAGEGFVAVGVDDRWHLIYDNSVLDMFISSESKKGLKYAWLVFFGFDRFCLVVETWSSIGEGLLPTGLTLLVLRRVVISNHQILIIEVPIFESSGWCEMEFCHILSYRKLEIVKYKMMSTFKAHYLGV